MGLRAMLSALWNHKSARPPERASLRLSAVSLKTEADLSVDRNKAMDANNRASMGVVLDASRALAAESRIRAMLGGMIDVADRGRDHDGRG